MSEDPATNGSNWFQYASNNPVDLGDLTGRAADELLNIVKDMFDDGELDEGFFRKFCDKSTGLAERCHRMITKQHYSVDDIEQMIKMKEQEYKSDLNLEEVMGETDEELMADIEFGEDVVLEVEVIAEEEAGG